MKGFTRTNLEGLRVDVAKALEAVEEKHNIKLEMGNSSYDSNTTTFKIVANIKDSSGNALSREAERFKYNAAHFGFKETDLFREFRLEGKTYKVIGYNNRAKTRPIIIENVVTGRKASITVDYLRESLNK